VKLSFREYISKLRRAFYGKYERRNFFAVIRLHVLDLFLSCINGPVKNKKIEKRPERILVVNPFHQGDVVITTSLIRAIRANLPWVRIGFLVGSWSAFMLNGHEYVDHIHVVDHYKISRKPFGFIVKLYYYVNDLIKLIPRIRRLNYDVALIVNGHEPSFIPLCKLVGIRYVAGPESAGFGPLLDYKVAKRGHGIHEAHYQYKLLECLFAANVFPVDKIIPYLMVPYSPELRLSLDSKVKVSKREYVIIQPGTGNPAKEWSTDYWIILSKQLIQNGEFLIMCGSGIKEKLLCQKIVDACGEMAVNMVGELLWNEYLLLLKSAKGLIGLDSLAVHLASAFEIPTLAIMSGVGDVTRWFPLGDRSIYVTHAVPCSPCHTKPCKTRDCITKISPYHVFEVWNSHIKISRLSKVN
jgi:heptosyltransferase-3